MKSPKTTAFTLIELLVVIAIIAILAGLSLSVFGKVLEKGRATQDASNLRQLGIGTAAYLNDNNKTIFSNLTSVSSSASGSAGTLLYAPGLLEVNYLPNAQIFHSPFDKRVNAANPAPISYGVNANVLNRPASTTVAGFEGHFATLFVPSQLILYAPVYTGDPTVNTSWQGWDNGPVLLPMGGTGMTKGTHTGAQWINVLYGDLHVASIKFGTFQTTTNLSLGSATGVNGLTEWYPLGSQYGQ